MSLSRPHVVLIAAALGACAPAPGGSAPTPEATPDSATAAAPPAAPVASAPQLVERMRARYDGRWYRTLTFVQNNTLYRSGGGEERSQWLEYIKVPGRLRIDYLTAGSRSGVLVVNGTFYAFDNGKQVSTLKRTHPLLLLSADVYAIAPEVTLRQLDALGVDTAKFREADWRGRPAYVVGASAGDTTSSQFWVSADSLLVVRVIESRTAGARTVATDYHFNKYTDVGGFPIAVEVLMHRDGRPVFKEEYADVKVNVDIPDALFDPARWGEGAGARP